MRVTNLFKLLPLLLFSLFANANGQQIEPQALVRLLQKQQAPFILDVRTAQEYQQGHIQGAINISYDLLEENSQLIDAYKDKPVIVYCRSGKRAQRAEQILQRKGFTQLIDLKGHMNLWQQRGYPLVMTNE